MSKALTLVYNIAKQSYFISFYYIYVCGGMGVEYMLMSADTHGGQEKIACPQELVLVSHFKYLLGA